MVRVQMVTSMRICVPILVAAALLVARPTYAASILFGVSLNGHSSGSPGPSSLYTIDPVTGAGTLVGNIGYAVNSLAVDPATGILYGSTTSWSGAFNGLLAIDPTTGAATEVGAFGAGFTSILGLTFNSAGQLFGWHDPSDDDLVSINLSTGAATIVGDSGLSTGAHILAFNAADALLLVQGTEQFDINTSTGLASSLGFLSFTPGRGGSGFDFSTGLWWAPEGSAFNQDALIRISNLGANSFTDLDTDVEYLSAVTWGDTQATVPEPSALLLVATAFAGYARMRQRRRP